MDSPRGERVVAVGEDATDGMVSRAFGISFALDLGACFFRASPGPPSPPAVAVLSRSSEFNAQKCVQAP